MELLDRLKAAFPGAEFQKFVDLGLPCYIVTGPGGLYLRVTELPQPSVETVPSDSPYAGWLPRGPTWHNKD